MSCLEIATRVGKLAMASVLQALSGARIKEKAELFQTLMEATGLVSSITTDTASTADHIDDGFGFRSTRLH